MQALFLKKEKMSAVAVTPGAVAKIRESKIVTDELNVQVRSLVYVLLLSLRVSRFVSRGRFLSFFQKLFSILFLLGFPTTKVLRCVGLKIFSRVSKKNKSKN